MKLANREIGTGNVFVTFECGPNHGGDYKEAERLVKSAIEAGADAVKFQAIDADRLMRDKTAMFKYLGGEKPLYDILKTYDLTEQDHAGLKSVADHGGIGYFFTCLFPEHIDMAMRLGCDTVKICSSDINNFSLISYAIQSGLIVQIDTGNATLSEICAAYNLFDRENSTDRVIIHHCPSGYPARVESINLKFIKTLKHMFRCPIAFSDHSESWSMDISAICLGADMIEKTLTMDHMQDGVEHAYSVDPVGAFFFVEQIRELEVALGDGFKTDSDINFDGRKIGRRSVTAACDLVPGSVLTPDVVYYSRPEIDGALLPSDDFVLRRVKRFIKMGEPIMKVDI